MFIFMYMCQFYRKQVQKMKGVFLGGFFVCFFLLRAESGKSLCDALCFLWKILHTVSGWAFKKTLL